MPEHNSNDHAPIGINHLTVQVSIPDAATTDADTETDTPDNAR